MAEDVVKLLQGDHQAVQALLLRFDNLSGSRHEHFCELVQTLVGHEVAEELVVFPLLREDANGDAVVQDRLAEQAEAERLLAELEKEDPSSVEFTQKFTTLRDAVLTHAHAEESTVFPLLEQRTTPEERQELGDRYTNAKTRAPTHPHPHAPDTPPGNKLLGPVAALFDRARDAVHH